MYMLSKPFAVQLEVTDSCNNLCGLCYASSWVRPNNKAKPEILEIARKIVENDLFDVIITGGEPLLLGIENLIKILKLFSDHNIHATVNTNGRLLDKKTCRLLKQYGLRGVLVSLHSWIDDLHDEIVNVPGAAVETKAGIKNALEAGLQVGVNQVIDSRNIATMFYSSQELQSMGVHGLSFTRTISPLNVDHRMEMIEAVRFIDELINCERKLTIPVGSLTPIPFCVDPRVKDLKKKIQCMGGKSVAAISCYGDVRFCPLDPNIWGNVFQEDFGAIWKLIASWRENLKVPSQCAACSFVADCGGGCRVASKRYFDDYKAKDPWARDAVTNYRRKVVSKEFDPDGLYLKLSDIRWRQEDESFLLHSGGVSMLVNSDGVKFLEILPPQFVPSQLLTTTSESREKQLEYLRALYNNGMIVKAANQ